MNPLLLRLACRYLVPLLLGLSVLILYRGHNYPGGGFIAGLTASCACLLVALSSGWASARRWLRWHPVHFLAVGLGIAVGSALLAPLGGGTFFAGRWLPGFEVPLLGLVKLGTPVLFDVGVCLTVIGFVLNCAFSLSEGEES